MGFWEPLFFWIFALGAIVTSTAVIRFRNPLYSALSLIVDFFCFAGLYALLSAHFIAVTQILVYTGAIMVLFLFIIMLLNLKDDELEQFDFRIHHLLAFGSAAGLLVLITSAILPLANKKFVDDARVESAKTYNTAMKGHEKAMAQVEKETDPKKRQMMEIQTKRQKPQYMVKTRSLLNPLYIDLNEAGLEDVYRQKIKAFQAGRVSPASGKYPRFKNTGPMVIPPSMTGLGLKTERGEIRASRKPASFGTVAPISVLIVNRFVIPFELTAILLLAAIIGAMIIAKRRL